jgi:proteasome-associated ATPase
MRNGSKDTLHFRDLVSGALLKSVVDRAKDTAIRRAIAEPSVLHGLSLDDLREAIDAEYKENEIFPKSDVMEDWLKLIDVEPESVANVRPVQTGKGEAFARKQIV